MRLTRRFSLPFMGRNSEAQPRRAGTSRDRAPGIRLPHPDGFAVVPPHKGEGGFS